MIEFVYTEGTTTENFWQKVAEGKVKFYRVRGNGTTRRIQYLVNGTEAREVAEYISEQREDGVSMRKLSAELHLSVATIRRTLNALILAEEVEDLEADEIGDLLSEATNEGTPKTAPDAPVQSEQPTDQNPLDADKLAEAEAEREQRKAEQASTEKDTNS